MAAVHFHSPREAQANFERIARRVPASLLLHLPLLLAESPSPDSALNLFERLVYPESLDVIRSLERHPQLLHYALALFASSQYLGETLIQNTDLLPGLLREDSLGRVQSAEDFAGAFARFRSRSIRGRYLAAARPLQAARVRAHRACATFSASPPWPRSPPRYRLLPMCSSKRRCASASPTCASATARRSITTRKTGWSRLASACFRSANWAAMS